MMDKYRMRDKMTIIASTAARSAHERILAEMVRARMLINEAETGNATFDPARKIVETNEIKPPPSVAPVVPIESLPDEQPIESVLRESAFVVNSKLIDTQEIVGTVKKNINPPPNTPRPAPPRSQTAPYKHIDRNPIAENQLLLGPNGKPLVTVSKEEYAARPKGSVLQRPEPAIPPKATGHSRETSIIEPVKGSGPKSNAMAFAAYRAKHNGH